MVLRKPPILIGGTLVVLFLFAAVVGPFIAPYSPMDQDLKHAREGPSKEHWFGTDQLGRDIFSRVIVGARITLVISMSTLAIAGSVGISIGLMAGYFGGRTDSILMRLIDIQLAIPNLVLALVLIGIIGSGLNSLVFAISFIAYPPFARLTRGCTLKAKEEGYVDSARAIGASKRRIVSKHVLPNIAPYILSLATVRLGRVVLTASSLGFLGLGAEPGVPEWGMMVAQGRTLFRSHPYIMIFPGLAILLVVIGFNLLGDGLRDSMDPRLRNS